MIQRPIEQVKERDLLALLAGQAAESRTLEFKSELSTRSEREVKEFLADVSALANTQGGDIIYGLQDRGGVASNLVGLDVADLDEKLTGLENSIREGVEPNLTSAQLHWVPLQAGGGALVIRVRPSLAAPHRVKRNNVFYARHSKGRFEMDAQHLREAFTASEQLPVKLRALHADAVAAAHGADMPFVMKTQPHAVVSVMPLGHFRETRDVGVTPENALAPYRANGMYPMHILEGVLLHSQLGPDNTVSAYALTHRRGRTDAAWTLGGSRTIDGGRQIHRVWPKYFEHGLIDAARSSAVKLRDLGVDGPWVIFASVFRIKGHHLVVGDDAATRPAWREGAVLPEVITDQVDEAALLPIFRSFWLLFGEPRPDGIQYR